MNNFKKVGLTALGTALVATAASAGEVSVSGIAGINYVGNSGAGAANTANGDNKWSMKNTINFSGSADLDNGFAVTYFQNMSGGSVVNAYFSVDMGDAGTYSFSQSGISGPITGWDDMTPTAGEETWDIKGGGGEAGPTNGQSETDSQHYVVSPMDGLTVKAAYLTAGASVAESNIELGAEYTGVEGLAIGYGVGDNNTTAGTTIENTVAYATYAIDAFTIGVQSNSTDSTAASGDEDFVAVGVSYAVSDDFSVSYGQHEYTSGTDTDVQESSGFSASYTMGGTSIKAAFNSTDNIRAAASNDEDSFEIAISFAF